MISTNILIIEKLNAFLNEIISQKEKRELYVFSSTDFTRNRSLSIRIVILLILNQLKRSLSIELESFFSSIGKSVVTKSAFSQQRQKLKPSFFKSWNNVLTNSLYEHGNKQLTYWNGYRLLAIDGTTITLPDTPDLREYYGQSGNKHGANLVTGRVSILYDVLNKIVIQGCLEPKKVSERKMARDLIDQVGKGDLLLFDRGYPSFELFYLLQQQNCKVVMRARADFNKIVEEFALSDRRDDILEIPATYKAIKGLQEKNISIDESERIKLRVVKITLNTGEEEILITNLYDYQVYNPEKLKKLYALRWPIETFYGYLKNELQVECFSGIKQVCIEQDFYSSLFLFNLQCLIEKQSDKYLQFINRKRKITYKINKNVSWALLKDRIIQLFLYQNDIQRILLQLQALFERYLESVRPDRKYPRIKKAIKINGKYHTLSNYKRAI